MISSPDYTYDLRLEDKVVTVKVKIRIQFDVQSTDIRMYLIHHIIDKTYGSVY